MAKAIMIQGTMSNAGKSLITAGLCRIFAQDGYKVAPFKSQNMALNSFITSDGLEMGRAQVMQAEAAGLEPSVLMNPILLKPTNDTGSQVILNGQVFGNMGAKEYFQFKKNLRPHVIEAYEKLSADYDIVVIEGAGSPAEINLKAEDLVNMGMAKIAKAPVLLAGDVDRGGVFAQLYGTVELLDEDEKDMVKGLIINKFRGDKTILDPGIEKIENMMNIPVVGVAPYIDIDIDDEDSLSDRLCTGAADEIDIAVIRLPRLSNFTDFNVFERFKGVSVRYVTKASQLRNPDMIILPGTKNTMKDLLWLRQNGLEALILKHASFGNPVFGICGGYQMLGETLEDPHKVEEGGSVKGMGLLPLKTVFHKEKHRTRVTGRFDDSVESSYFGKLKNQSFVGYEIHMGQTQTLHGSDLDALCRIRTGTEPTMPEGFHKENVFGCYIHGIFDTPCVAETLIKTIADIKGVDFQSLGSLSAKEYKEKQYDLLADTLRNALDMDKIYEILENGI